MKIRLIHTLSVLFLALGIFSCTSETEIYSNEDGAGVPSESGIRFVIQTPSPDDVVTRGARAAEPPFHTDKEYAVKKMALYIFAKKDKAQSDTDDQYEFLKKKEDIGFVGSGTPGESGTDLTNGQLSYTEPITKDMIGKTVKIMLVANDKVETANTGMTLDAFKKSLATAVLTNEQSADVISGNIYAAAPSGEVTGIVMGAAAYKGETEGQNEAVKLTPMGVDMKAAFQRAVARVDFVHNTPNMIVTGLKIKNAASKAYIFKQGTTAIPGDAQADLTLLPTSMYNDDLSQGISFKEGTPKPGDDGTDFNQENNLKHVFYMYEQVNAVSPGTCATIEITYKLEINGKYKQGTLSVPFKKGEPAPDTYVNTTRNTLYTVVMGNGERAEDVNNITRLVVADWDEENIDEPFDPNEDDHSEVIKDPSKAEIGDFYLSDGTFRKSDYSFTLNEKKKVIGIVFQTYKNAPERFGQAEKDALSAKGVKEPHGMVMAVKCANGGKWCAWKSENTTSNLTTCDTKAKCYNDISGLANWQTVESLPDEGFAKHPAFKAVADFAKTVPAPENTTGWFLPSIGQWWDIVATLGNNKKAQDPTEQEGSESASWYWYDRENDGGKNTADAINEHLNKIGASYVDLIEKGSNKHRYWTSSEYSETNARHVFFNSTYLYVNNGNKNDVNYVRAVLAY